MDAKENATIGRRGFIATLAGLSLGILTGGPEPAQATKTRLKDLLQLDVNKDILYRDQGDGALLFRAETGDLRYINPPGKEVFLALKREEDLNQVIDRLHRLYPEVDRHRLLDDIKGFLRELEANGFISPLDVRQIIRHG